MVLKRRTVLPTNKLKLAYGFLSLWVFLVLDFIFNPVVRRNNEGTDSVVRRNNEQPRSSREREREINQVSSCHQVSPCHYLSRITQI